MLSKNSKIFLLALISLLLLILYGLFATIYEFKNESAVRKNIVLRKSRNVFIDLGTNDGQSVKYFIDRPLTRKDNESLEGYGSLDGKKWEIYAIEANPYFNSILENVKIYCEILGHEFNLYTETAAWVKNEKLVFYLDTVNSKYSFWGSSLLKQHPDVVSSGFKNVSVNGVDISEILEKYNPEDEIVLKIDIEGSEYELLLHLIKTGKLHLVDIIAVEYHSRFLKDRKYSHSDLESFFKEYFKIFNIRNVLWY